MYPSLVLDADHFTLIHRAIDRGDSNSAEFLLEHGASPSLPSPTTGDTPLHLASRNPGLSQTVKLLLEKGANVNAQNKEGKTPLHSCVEIGSEDILSMILNTKQVNFECKTKEGHTPIWMALKTYEPESSKVLQHLVDAGASVNAICSPNGDSLLHLCSKDRLDAAGIFLCRNGANVNHQNAAGETPLHAACREGLHELVSEMLKQGANPNAAVLTSQETPLHISLKNGHIACAEVLLKSELPNKRKINLELKDANGFTILGVALKHLHLEFAKELVEAGADVNVVDFDDQSLLCKLIQSKEVQAVLFLLEHGVDINSTQREAPLFCALESQMGSVVEALCKKGVDMSITNKNGDCALWIAIKNGLENIASIFVRYGVDVDFWQEGSSGYYESLLHRSIAEHEEDVGVFLIRAGCDINSPRKFGPEGSTVTKDISTPLHLATAAGLNTVVGTLLEHGADINAKDSDGRTPLFIAVQNQHDILTGLLLQQSQIDLSIRDKSGLTPFATAVKSRNNKAAQAILHRYPSAAEQHDIRGRNFLHLAIESVDIESFLFLLSINVDVNCRTKDSRQLSALHLAIQSQSELMVRNLLLAGANVNERTPQKLTPLHIASELGFAGICSILLENGADFNAVDNELNNALHIAVKQGNAEVCRVLLTESHINAEAVNLKGQNPVHYLARFGKENAADIFKLFMESMPDYPINNSDVDGNTPLLLAYTKGNGGLCRAIVKVKGCLGAMNKDGVTIFNYQVPTKQLLYRILDFLTEEPPWAEGDICLECGIKFSITVRKHHCRHCGRLLCNKCSEKNIPIVKFNLNKPVRVCNSCFEVLTLGTSVI